MYMDESWGDARATAGRHTLMPPHFEGTYFGGIRLHNRLSYIIRFNTSSSEFFYYKYTTRLSYYTCYSERSELNGSACIHYDLFRNRISIYIIENSGIVSQ